MISKSGVDTEEVTGCLNKKWQDSDGMIKGEDNRRMEIGKSAMYGEMEISTLTIPLEGSPTNRYHIKLD